LAADRDAGRYPCRAEGDARSVTAEQPYHTGARNAEFAEHGIIWSVDNKGLVAIVQQAATVVGGYWLKLEMVGHKIVTATTGYRSGCGIEKYYLNVISEFFHIVEDLMDKNTCLVSAKKR